MQMTWTKWVRKIAFAAGLGAACWALTAAGALSQTTDSTSDDSQTGSTQSTTSSSSQTRDRDSQSGRTSSSDDEQSTGRTSQTRDRASTGSTSSRTGTSDYGASQSGSRSRGIQSGFGSTQTGDNRSDAESGSRYNYGTSPSGGFESNQFGGRDAPRDARDQFQDTRNQSRDAIGEARDDMRSTTRSSRDQSQTDSRSRGAQDRQQATDRRDSWQSDRSFSRDDRDFDRDERSQTRDEQRSFSGDDRSFDRDDRSFDREDRSFTRDDPSRADDRTEQGDSRSTTRSRTDVRSSAAGRSSTQINRAADIGIWFNRGTRDGLVISDLASSGPITRFGFREGDRIISVNGTRVSSEQQFIQYLLSPQHQNQRAQIIVWRNNQQVPIWVEPWALVESHSSSVAQSDPLETYGIVLDDRYSSPVVWKVYQQTPAYYAGIRSGDVIVAWSGQHVNSAQDLGQLVEQNPRGEIAVQVSRNRQLRQLTLEASDNSARTALRPDYDESSDAIGTRPSDSFGATSRGYLQQGYSQGYQGQSYVQPASGYSQPSSGAYYQSGQTYGQAGVYTQPDTNYGQRSGLLNRSGQGGVLPRLRGR